LKKEIN
jgi:hypothetical protein